MRASKIRLWHAQNLLIIHRKYELWIILSIFSCNLSTENVKIGLLEILLWWMEFLPKKLIRVFSVRILKLHFFCIKLYKTVILNNFCFYCLLDLDVI